MDVLWWDVLVSDGLSLPRVLVELAREQAGYVSTAQVRECRVSERHRRQLVGSGRWERVARGVYDTGILARGLQECHVYDRERRRAVWRALVACPDGVALGAGALVMHGVRGLPRGLVVEIAMRDGRYAQSRAGFRIRQVDMRGDAVRLGRALVARLPLAFVQALGSLDRESWVACANDALRRGMLTEVGLANALHLARGRRGIATKRHWFGLTNTLLESPLETRAWLALWDAGIAPDQLQRDICAPDGSHLGRADMAWYLGEGRWLLVEIDGNQYHSSDAQRTADAVRQNSVLKELRYRLLRYRTAQLYPVGAFVTEISDVLRAEGWLPGRPFPEPASVVDRGRSTTHLAPPRQGC